MTKKNEIIDDLEILSEQQVTDFKRRMRGTPKTLKEAIQNGIDEFKEIGKEDEAYFVAIHVKDFLSQAFTISMHHIERLPHQMDFLHLFQRITKGIE